MHCFLLLAQFQHATDWGFVLMWGVYLAATGGLMAASYFLLPKRLRQRGLWFKLPMGVVVLQLTLALMAFALDESLGLPRVFLFILNLPMLHLPGLPIFDHVGGASQGFWPGGAIRWSVMLLTWLPLPFVTGLVLDRRRRREKGMHGHS